MKASADELSAALRSCRHYFSTALVFSLGINLLYLAAPLYMLQVYDRVISSGSGVTLLMLTLIVLVAFAALAGLDMVRARILSAASVRLDRMLGERVVAVTFDQAGRGTPLGSQPLRDLDTFRGFVGGGGVNALFDLPWAPLYVLVIFLLHPLLGAFALCCAVALMATALLNERLTRVPLKDAGDAANRNYRFTELSTRNWEPVQAMGMLPGLLGRWSRDRDRMIDRQSAAAHRMAATGSFTRFLRLAMQSLILGLGAYLVIERQATVGAMFAASILLARALQPLEQIVGAWRGFTAARSALDRIRTFLALSPKPADRLVLPRPLGRISVESLTYGVRGNPKPILAGVTFNVEPGEVVAIIGPSGAGKSTLARHILGLLTPVSGVARLDGADVAKWPREQIGRHVGYLPQDIELLADTVAANIGRFDAGDEDVIAAARLAGVHETILGLPEGYDTPVGEGGAVLSGGMRQRIALARAVYGSPSLVVLDEPNSNLDVDGDVALGNCIVQLKARGATTVIVSHRSGTLGVVDKILVMKEGAAAMFGPRNEVLQRLSARPTAVRPVYAAAGSPRS